MIPALRALRALAPLLLLTSLPLEAQQVAKSAPVAVPAIQPNASPQFTRPDDPWIYRGTDIPIDREWLFGEMPNGVRYAVRNNRVPPGQVSIRIRIDAGSLNEQDSELGYAHLIEHLTFRESKYLGEAEAIPHFQRLGMSLGNDTNAITSPTQTVYKLDIPAANDAKLEESIKLLSGMIREPVFSARNVAAEVPIVLAERRERNGPDRRIVETTNEVFFAGQRLATRFPIGTVETLQAATPRAVQAFHHRWYRPENTVIVIAGDGDPAAARGAGRAVFRRLEGVRPERSAARLRQAAGAARRRSGQSGRRDEGHRRAGPAAPAQLRDPAPVAPGDRQYRVQPRPAARRGRRDDHQPPASRRARARAAASCSPRSGGRNPAVRPTARMSTSPRSARTGEPRWPTCAR
jgi:zinc protease